MTIIGAPSNSHYFAGVTLLVTHYNRSRSLERLLNAFADQHCSFEEIVVSDDCSNPEHLDKLVQLQQEYGFRLITAPENRGLGNNINKGQEVVTTPYTLYVQEDFIPLNGFAPHVLDAIELMDERRDLDIVRFYSYFMYPTLVPYKRNFSEMIFDPWLIDHWKFNFYSDHPHLRRSTFAEKFGRYAEGIDVVRTEFRMCLTFIKRKGKGLLYNGIYELFDQVNSIQESSTVPRSQWRQRKTPFILFLRSVYLKYKLIKNTLEVRLMKAAD